MFVVEQVEYRKFISFENIIFWTMEDIAQIWQFGDPHKLARGFKLSALRKRNVVILFEAKYRFDFLKYLCLTI